MRFNGAVYRASAVAARAIRSAQSSKSRRFVRIDDTGLPPTRFGTMGGYCRPRVIGPRVTCVAALHFLFHLGVGALPETAQVLGDLQRFAARRSEEHTSELPSLMRISYAV